MIAHHVCHGGYEKCHPDKTRWSRFKLVLVPFGDDSMIGLIG